MDEQFQLIVAADVTSAANDKQQATPLAETTMDNLKAAAIELPQKDDGTGAAKVPLTV